MDKIMVIDGNSIVNRAFYAIRTLTNKHGQPTNAIYGFLKILFKYVDDVAPSGICVAFDVSAPTFRHKRFVEYKANRKGMPSELRSQMPILKQVLNAMNITMLELEGYEADDIIGTVSKKCEKDKISCYIVTGDKDDLQLAGENTKILLISTKGGNTQTTEYDHKAIYDTFGIRPEEFIEVKALMGDASDNIPGVAGIGEKTAFDLVAKYKTLENIFDNLGEVSPNVRKKLETGREEAFMSRELATIMCDVPIEFDVDNFATKPYDTVKLLELFEDLEFHSLKSRIQLGNIENLPSEAQEVTVQELKNHIGSTLCYKLNTGSDGIYFGLAGFAAKTTNIEDLRDIFENPQIKKISHDIKEDMVYLKSHNIDMAGVAFDTKIGAYIIDPQRKDYEIDELLTEYLGLKISGNTPIELAAAQASAIERLYEYLDSAIAQRGQASLYYDVELPLVQVLAQMQIAGVLIDEDGLKQFGEILERRIEQLTDAIYNVCGCEFNINSPKQLGEVLFEKLRLPVIKQTKTGYSTDAEVLEKLRGQSNAIEYLLEFRQLVKLKSTYVDGLLAVKSDDGRIHSNFNQTVTVTGRISSTEPNLQNIPVRYELGREIRKMFIAAKPDYVLVDADYSQIELRVLAHIADDKDMIDAFEHDMDIHTKTASEVFDVAPVFVTGEMRSRAKAVNFGIVYGIGDFSLAQDIGITRAEAKRYIDNYLNTYKGVKKYMTETVENGKRDGFVSTIFGRRRYMPELKSSNFQVRSFGERVAMNAPIQGSAADIIKIAMVRVHERLRKEGLKSRLILQVHDELIIEAHHSEVERVREIVSSEMENAAELSVKLKVDIGIGENWHDAK